VALAEAILVCLADEPLSGYDLAKSFDTSIGFFWHADHQQIYRELRKLKDRGWVDDELVIQHTRPNKRRYSITAAGLERLMAWSQENRPAPPVKDDMMVKLYGLAHVDVAAVADQIGDRLAGHRQRLALYERIEAVVFADLDRSDSAAVGRFLGLRLGLAHERAWIDWCRTALDLLGHPAR
jgi:DNA-binding PadR family transcriptional regulator